MPLRTYPLITHPAFLRFVEDREARLKSLDYIAPADVPTHRPVLGHIYEISEYLRISPQLIRSMMIRKHKHYRQFEVRKRNGDTRLISAPRTFLKVVQWWIYDTILSNTEIPGYVFGFAKGRSFIDNAKQHVGARHILNIDIENFFPSIRAYLIFDVFQKLGYSNQVSIALTELVTLEEGLPQGAPSSPALSNLIFLEVDREIREIAIGHGIEYTRYADDLTFSSNERIQGSLVDGISAVLAKLHLRLNPKKTNFMGPNQRKEVTGLVLGEAGVALDRRFLNSARGWFHTIRLNPIEHMMEVERVRGTLALIHSVGGRGSSRVIDLGKEAMVQLVIARRMIPPASPTSE